MDRNAEVQKGHTISVLCYIEADLPPELSKSEAVAKVMTEVTKQDMPFDAAVSIKELIVDGVKQDRGDVFDILIDMAKPKD